MKRIITLLFSGALILLSGCDKQTEETLYSIAVESVDNGSAEALVAGKKVIEATENSEVTLSATPHAEFLFSEWVVSDNVALADATANPATFTMPAADVNVMAEFIPILYAIIVTADDNGSAEAQVDGVAAAEAAKGATVTLTAKANDEYSFARWVVVSGDVKLTDAAANPATFTMPSGEINVRAEFTHTPSLYSVEVEAGDNGTAEAQVDGKTATQAVKGATVTLKATPDDNYSFARWVVVNGEVTLDDETANPATFTMPEGGVKIKAEFTYTPGLYTITLEDDDNGTAEAQVDGEAATQAAKGATVGITAKANEGYVFSKWVVSDNVTLSDATANPATFTMPEGGVSIKAEFVAVLYAITLEPSDNGNVEAQVDGEAATQAAKGATVAITAKANEGYVFSKWVVSDSVTLDDATANPATFTMPEGGVSIKAEFVAVLYAITLEPSGNGTIEAQVDGEAATQAAKGATVTLKATPDDNYLFARWVVVNGEVTLSDETANPATFTMPAGEVSVKAEFEQEANLFDKITDPAFREYCRTFDRDGDGILTAQEAAKATGINLPPGGVESLAGIEVFTKLIYLNCSENELSALDVSNCTNLMYLFCNENQLVALNVSGCTQLIELCCNDNQLPALNVTGLTELTRLECNKNKISALDVRSCPKLTKLACERNRLVTLDVSNCAKLILFNCSRNQLITLNVDGCTELKDLSCVENQLTTLNVGGCRKLDTLVCYSNRLTVLDISGCNLLKLLQCKSNEISKILVWDTFDVANPKNSIETLYYDSGVVFERKAH